MKNGIPIRYPPSESMSVSGNGRPVAGLIGPEYGRGRSSRAHWNRNSLDSAEEKTEVRLPFTAWE
jgi:hypothetical protein